MVRAGFRKKRDLYRFIKNIGALLLVEDYSWEKEFDKYNNELNVYGELDDLNDELYSPGISSQRSVGEDRKNKVLELIRKVKE